MRKTAFLVAVAAALGQSPLAYPAAADGAETVPIPEATRLNALKSANWKEAPAVNLELRDYGLSPRELRFKAGKPYRLVITNNGAHSHYFNAPQFMKNVAARYALVKDQVEVKADFFREFELARRGGSVEFHFVPLTAGSYQMYCHLEGKEHEGVQATIVVE